MMHDEPSPEADESTRTARPWLRKVVALAAILALVLTAVMSQWPGSPAPSAGAAGPYSNPHAGGSATTDSCAACHRTHDGQTRALVETASAQHAVCLTCHDGTGAATNVGAEFSGAPANDVAAGKYYQHPVMSSSATRHTSGQSDEFAGVSNRHTECTDCHNPHKVNTSLAAAPSPAGWTASGSLAGVTGVSQTKLWMNPISNEYQLCLKCHSSYTVLPAGAKDKVAEFDRSTTTGSFHPIEAAGKNTTAAMDASLAGGKLWNTFTSTSTIRCTQCHADSRLVGNPAVPGTPATTARLAPHASRNPSLLIANYNGTVLKSKNSAYASYGATDFALCFLCHRETPFSSQKSGTTATNFNKGTGADAESLHYKHTADIADKGSGGTDIKVAGAGQGNAICAECHYNSHGSPTTKGLVVFAPAVQGYPTLTSAPVWTPGAAGGTCTLTCHGKQHTGGSEYTYPIGGAGGVIAIAPAPTAAGDSPTAPAPPPPVPVALRAARASTNGVAGGASIRMDLPAGVQNGDVLVMVVTLRVVNGATITTPAGWVRLGTPTTTADGTLQQGVYWRLASNEPASYSVSFSLNPLRASGVIAAVSGASKAQLAKAAYGSLASEPGLTVRAPSLGTWEAADGIDLFVGGMAFAANIPRAPSGYSEPGNATATSGSGAAGTTTGLAFRALTGATTSGSVSAGWLGTAGSSIGTHVFVAK